jgi:uncharacterized protein (DUF608 family)
MAEKSSQKKYNSNYKNEQLNYLAFPLGGIGSGMICLEGTGALSHVSLRHRPEVYNEPVMFSAICLKDGKGNLARVLEGPVPKWKAKFPWGISQGHDGASGNGAGGHPFGLPRFPSSVFDTRFPFGKVTLKDTKIPLAVEITGWSPFTPGKADDSSLPAAALEYCFKNTSKKPVDAVYSFHAANFMATEKKPEERKDSVCSRKNGFTLTQPTLPGKPEAQGEFCVFVDGCAAKTNCAWFRGGWFDPLTMVWKEIESGQPVSRLALKDGAPSPGGSLSVPLKLKPGEEKTVRLLLAWHVPHSSLFIGETCSCGTEKKCDETYAPWYATKFKDVAAVAAYWSRHYAKLKKESLKFADAFYDTTLPPEVVEAVAANLTILKSPTVLRQHDGRIWAWEGCCDGVGCCSGSCTHVWNYAQALPHLFPELERTLRQTEFYENQDERGHQNFRAWLPIRPVTNHGNHAAADGQLGGIMKIYREWRVSGASRWMKSFWPRVKQSLAYCIETWDPDHLGVLIEPHHNTYDIEFWGPDGMCSSFYLGALAAAIRMGDECGEDVSLYRELLAKGKNFLEKKLFNGEYFEQIIQWKNLRAGDPTAVKALCHSGYSPEAEKLLRKEGPKYQYGSGCLSDGVLGFWLAEMCGLGDELVDRKMVQSHLKAVHRHNLRKDLSEHANPQRPGYALGDEGGLLLCTWPRGGKLSLPFVYCQEVFTGIEYQVASHLMLCGCIKEGREIVRTARDRYDGTVRNPFNEYECGHWYARALSSYGLVQGLTGVRYDAVEKVLYVNPSTKDNFRSFLATATGFGTVEYKNGKAKLTVLSGKIEVKRIDTGS